MADSREAEVKTRSIAALLGVCALCGQDLPDWVLNLSRVKRQAKGEFQRLTNYACLETVTRSQRHVGAAVFKALDTIRVEVAVINGKEMFAPQGGKQFQDVEVDTLATEGVIGTGSFDTLARNLFVFDVARTTGHGEDKLGERPALWFGWAISPMADAFKLSGKYGEAYVGEAGQYWVDAETLQLLRIEQHATDIPATIDFREVRTTIDYGKVSIGSGELLLPLKAETIVIDGDGTVNRNITEFSNCREYGSESMIRFSDDSDPAAAPGTPPGKKKK
jgi:hypothetical protein